MRSARLSSMRKIVSADGRFSQWMILTRPSIFEFCIHGPQQTLAPNSNERRSRISSLASPNSRRRTGSQLGKQHQLHKRDSIQKFNTTSKLTNNVAGPDTISTPIQEFGEVQFPTWTSPAEERAYAEGFFRAIQNGQPDEVMRVLTDPRSAGLVGSLPQTVFLEALHRLSPAHFVEPFRKLHHPLHAWSVLKNGIKRIEKVFDEFVRNLFTITRYRTAGGHPFQLDEYRHLLGCARAMGNEPFATQLWDSMKRDGIAPDVICYNHYMEASVWDHCYTGRARYNLRALPYNYRKRRSSDPAPDWQGFGTGARSVRKQVLNVFTQMVNEGHLPDERAYINTLLASARVGRVPGIHHVLKMVWNIDVDALKQQPDNSKLPAPTAYDPQSALYPTENLLFAVAHALGTNNDIAGALRTTDFISTSYGIPISERVWHELFERAYVLSKQRTIKSIREQQANEIGSISMDTVRSLYDTMTSAPHNVKPTMQILRCMINIGIDSFSLEECKAYLDEAYKLLQESRAKQSQARSLVRRCLRPALRATESRCQQGKNPDPSLFEDPLLAEAIQAYDIIRLQVYQETYLLKRILWILIRVPNWKDISSQKWCFQERPKMEEEWRDFIPAKKQLFYGENVIWHLRGSSFRDRHWASFCRIPVRRCTDRELFHPTERLARNETTYWNDFLTAYPFLDTTISPINRLFTFELPDSPEFVKSRQEMRESWVEYPDEHPLSTKNNPNGGFYGRLAALGMLEKSRERTIFLLDQSNWNWGEI